MSTLLKYSGIVTKIRAMSSHLLDQNDYRTLSQFQTVFDVVAFLKKQPSYEAVFAPFDERMLHRSDIEKLLIQSLYSDYSKLYRFGDTHVRAFLLFYLKQYEIDLINYCLRITCNSYPEPFDLAHKRAFFNQYSKLSIDRLITSTTPEELVDQLQGTEYYKPLKRLQETSDPSLFDYNLALDLHYYSNLWRQRKKFLKKDEMELFTNEIGSKIDLLNLQLIYRSKKFYNLTSTETYALLIPANYHLNNEQIQTLVEAATMEDFSKASEATYYGKRFGAIDTLTFGKMYKTCLKDRYVRDANRFPYSLAPVNKYLYEKEDEIKKITTTLECIRYGIDSEETLHYIGGND